MTSSLTVVAGLEYFGRSAPRDPAWSDGSRTLSFGEVDERSTRAATALIELGVGRGERVIVMLENQLRSAEVLAAVAKAGAVIVPTNTHATTTEFGELLDRATPAAVITESKFGDAVGVSGHHQPSLAFAVDELDGFRSWQALVDAGARRGPLPQLDERDVFCISFTGGTTGRAKGVMLSHRSRALTFSGMAADFGLGPHRRTINATPLYHGAGFAYGFGFMVAGAHVVTMRRWDPEHLLSLVRSHRPHQIFLVPSQLSDLRELGSAAMRDASFHEIPSVFVSAAPLTGDLKDWFVADFPEVTFADVYGGTEAGVVSVLKTPELTTRGRTVGQPWLMTEVAILDAHKQPVAPGEAGDLYSRSPYVFNGYFDDPEQTREVTTDDGFVTAADVAVQDDEGYLYIVDRSKDMIISGGVNVYPREVEEVLLRHPEITDAAVVGVPHVRWGEEVVAIVATTPGSQTDESALRGHCAQTLASYKVPKRVLVRQSLDRTVIGKLAKNELRQWAVEHLQVESR